MAGCFRHFTEQGQLDLRQKEDVFKVILATTNHGAELVPYTTDTPTLSDERLREIAAFVQYTHPSAGKWPPCPAPAGPNLQATMVPSTARNSLVSDSKNAKENSHVHD